jgi:hypothetical protein
MTEVKTCPVCGGTGLVAPGFYSGLKEMCWSPTDAPNEKCRSCDGNGYVIIRDLIPEITEEVTDERDSNNRMAERKTIPGNAY